MKALTEAKLTEKITITIQGKGSPTEIASSDMDLLKSLVNKTLDSRSRAVKKVAPNEQLFLPMAEEEEQNRSRKKSRRVYNGKHGHRIVLDVVNKLDGPTPLRIIRSRTTRNGYRPSSPSALVASLNRLIEKGVLKRVNMGVYAPTESTRKANKPEETKRNKSERISFSYLVLKAIGNAPATGWHTNTITKRIKSIRPASTDSSIRGILSILTRKGYLSRVERGVYRPGPRFGAGLRKYSK